MNAQTATIERPQVAEFAPPPARGNLAVVPPPASQYPQAEATTAYPPKIAKALVAIAREFGPVAKDGFNSFHKYNYQKWEDVLDRVSTLLPKHGLIISQSEIARSLFENDQMMSVTYAFTIVNEDGDMWPDRPVWTAIARARDQKGIPDDKAINKAHTQAHKYFLLHTFNIKTKETLEADADGEVSDSPPKPPKPGSAEAKALEGPRPITGTGPNPQDWADAFTAKIETAESSAEIDQWIEINKDTLDRLEGAAAAIHAGVMAKVAARRKALNPKPPKPGAANAAPPVEPKKTMPDPTAEPAAFIQYLTDKFAAFQTYEEGETYWNDTAEPTLDGLDVIVKEDAFGVWRKFELRFEG